MPAAAPRAARNEGLVPPLAPGQDLVQKFRRGCAHRRHMELRAAPGRRSHIARAAFLEERRVQLNKYMQARGLATRMRTGRLRGWCRRWRRESTADAVPRAVAPRGFSHLRARYHAQDLTKLTPVLHTTEFQTFIAVNECVPASCARARVCVSVGACACFTPAPQEPRYHRATPANDGGRVRRRHVWAGGLLL
jgi:hypothetical protein